MSRSWGLFDVLRGQNSSDFARRLPGQIVLVDLHRTSNNYSNTTHAYLGEAWFFEASKPRGLELEVTLLFLLGAKPLSLGCFGLANPWV